ncbi:MAG: hypothetical protein EPO06_09185 [Burkholderiaceae bacterium]|nr:MAG: hypothetical protein EPO06_09185 [Burkholderiaceae bacterium]
MALHDWIGFLAGLLTTVAFVPQALMTWKNKSARDISLGMYSIFTSGVLLWVIYGALAGIWPVLITNIVTLLLALFILVMKLRFG